MIILIKTLSETLSELLLLLKDSIFMDIFLIFFGAVLGFFGSYLNFRFSENKKYKNSLDKFIIELNILREEIANNSFALKIESYVAGNHKKQILLKDSKNAYLEFNRYEHQKSLSKIEILLKEINLLKARLSGKKQEYYLLLKYSHKIEELFDKLTRYDFSKNPFENVNDIASLEKALNENYSEKVKAEFEKEYVPLLDNLITSMKIDAFERRNKSFHNWILKNIFNA